MGLVPEKAVMELAHDVRGVCLCGKLAQHSVKPATGGEQRRAH